MTEKFKLTTKFRSICAKSSLADKFLIRHLFLFVMLVVWRVNESIGARNGVQNRLLCNFLV